MLQKGANHTVHRTASNLAVGDLHVRSKRHMADAKCHHFLPQLYLRHFADAKERFYQIEKIHEVEAILHALSDPVRVAIFAQIDGSECSQNCFEFSEYE